MIESFLEENVTGKDQQSAKRKYIVFNIASIVSFVFGAFGVFLVYMTLYIPLSEGDSLTPVIVTMVFYLVLAVGCFILGYVFRRIRNGAILDFDYTFVSGSLRIAKIMNHVKRRPLIAIECDTIEAMDKLESDSYKRYETMAGIKKVIATPNLYVEDVNIYYLFFKKDGQPTLLLFEPSDALLIQIRRNSKFILRK